jgi:hypothetical protein
MLGRGAGGIVLLKVFFIFVRFVRRKGVVNLSQVVIPRPEALDQRKFVRVTLRIYSHVIKIPLFTGAAKKVPNNHTKTSIGIVNSVFTVN